MLSNCAGMSGAVYIVIVASETGELILEESRGYFLSSYVIVSIILFYVM